MKVIFYHLTRKNKKFIFNAMQQSILDTADQQSVIHTVILNRRADVLSLSNERKLIVNFRDMLGCASLTETLNGMVSRDSMIDAFEDQFAVTRLLICDSSADNGFEISLQSCYAAVCNYLLSVCVVEKTDNDCCISFNTPRYSDDGKVLAEFKINQSLEYFYDQYIVRSVPLSQNVQQHPLYHSDIGDEHQAKQRLLQKVSQPFLIYPGDEKKRRELEVDSFFYVCFLRIEKGQLEKDMVRIPCYIDRNLLYRRTRLPGSEQPKLIEGTNTLNFDTVLEDMIQMFKNTPRDELRTYLCRPVGEIVLSNSSIVSMAEPSVISTGSVSVGNSASVRSSRFSLFTCSELRPGLTDEIQSEMLVGVTLVDEQTGAQSTFL